MVRVGNNISTPLRFNTGAPQGCVLRPLLYSLFTHGCVAMHASNSIIKFADDTTVVGLITNNDETAYREEGRAVGVWCCHEILGVVGGIRRREQGSVECQFILRRTKSVTPTHRAHTIDQPKHRTKIVGEYTHENHHTTE